MLLRRLTLQHFALYRGWLDGLPIELLHAQYGQAGADLRDTRRSLDLLRDTLSAAGRRAKDTQAAHLLRLKPGSIPQTEMHAAPDVPALEDFRAQQDPTGFYSEAELLTLYRDTYPPQASPRVDRRIARNLSLRARQAEALARMERTLAQDPRPDDAVGDWFLPTVAAWLEADGLTTLAQLLAVIDRRGHRWYARVPGIGPRIGQRITDWLALYSAPLHHQMSPLALTPRRQFAADHAALTRPKTSDVVPFDTLRVPASLDGSAGVNRAPVSRNLLDVDTDYAAIESWLATRNRNPHTQRAYRREAERLLLWALFAKGKALSSLNTRDCAEYIDTFLKDPQPAERWCGPKTDRFSRYWKPFVKPLDTRSRKAAQTILSALCKWLVGQLYLASNPFGGLPKVAADTHIEVIGHSLTHGQWSYVLQTVTRVDYTPAQMRDFVALMLAYATGLRRAELAAATVGDLTRKALDGSLENAWQLNVLGKGTRQRVVPIPRPLMEMLQHYLCLRGLSRDPEACPPDTPLIAHASRAIGCLSPNGMGTVFKAIFARAADQLPPEQAGAARDLRRASTHWLRHTHSNHLLDSGADLRDVQANLGHANLQTTSIYLKGDAQRRFQAVDAFLNRALAVPQQA